MSVQPIREQVKSGRRSRGRPATTTLTAQQQREYVAANRAAASGPAALGRSVDDLTDHFGDDLYDRMLLDPTMRSKLDILFSWILSGGLQLSTAVEDATQPDFDQAREIRDFVQRCLDTHLRCSWPAFLWAMLGAIAYGNKVAEQVYALIEDGPDAGRIALVNLKVKPRWSVSFVVDEYFNIIGISAYTGPGSPAAGAGQMVRLDGNAKVLPRSKFVVLSFRPADGDPRGTSHLRPAYNPWNFKMQILPEWLKFLAIYAVPSLIGFTPEGATTDVPTTDAQGTPDLTQAVQTPEQEMADKLAEVRGGSAGAFPFGSKVQTYEVRGEGQVFAAGLNWANEEITQAILHQSLATNQSPNQARAAAETHADVLAIVVQAMKPYLSDVIYLDILRPLVRYNFGDALVHLTPHASMGVVEQADMSASMGGMATLFGAGYFTEEQLPEIDRRYGFPTRTAFPSQTPTKQEPAGPGGESQEQP